MKFRPQTAASYRNCPALLCLAAELLLLTRDCIRNMTGVTVNIVTLTIELNDNGFAVRAVVLQDVISSSLTRIQYPLSHKVDHIRILK